jgi:hypothetical protein
MVKSCRTCKQEKPLTEFSRYAQAADGLRPVCKCCINAYNRQKRAEHLHQYQTGQRKRYQLNPQKFRAEKLVYEAEHKAEKAAYDKVYRQRNALKQAQAKREWTERNRTNPLVKLKRNLRRRLHHVLAGTNKAASTMELIGCTIDELRSHLEGQFTALMSWDNYGPYGWHVDHRQPCYTFDLTDPDQQRVCFHFSNLRPLWWLENVSRPRPKHYASNSHPSTQ